MFTDFLEVEENLKMSRKLSDQNNGGEITNAYKLVGPYKQKKESYSPSKTSHDIQNDDQSEAEINGPARILFEDGDMPHS